MKFIRRGISVLATLVLIGGIFAFPHDARAEASLFIAPTTGRRTVGETFSLVVRVNTGGEPINAAEGSIVFNPAKVEVVSLSKTGSIFGLWTVDPTYSNAEGTIQFAGGLPSPGYNGSNGLILTITFRGKSATTINNSTSITLVSGAILANDGEGTNILTSLGRSAFFIGPQGTEDVPDSVDVTPQPSVDTTPTVISKTHPDPEKWYTSNDPEFLWTLSPGVETVSYLVTDRPNSNPGSNPDGLKSSVKFENLSDGNHFFHIKFRRNGVWGPIAHFPFNIDSVPPRSLKAQRLDDADDTNPQPLFNIEATDSSSGIDHFEMKLDGQEWFTLTENTQADTFKLPLQKPGITTFAVKAIDRAGNESEIEGTLTVASIDVPLIEHYPFEVARGEAFDVTGSAKAGYAVVVVFDRNTREAIRLETVADSDGKWSIQADNLPAGTYQVVAYARDEREAESLPSEEVQIKVTSPVLSIFFTLLRKLFTGIFVEEGFWFFVSLLFYLSIFLALVFDIVRRLPNAHAPFAHWRQKKTTSRKDSLHILKEYGKILEHMTNVQEDVEKEVDLLKKIATHRKLYPEEQYMKTKFVQYLKVLKKAKKK
ncbi:MAG: hypothetical protein KW806_00860 [Candidatus Yanofskybacteria bacterium]|nr:hypothetical protein [Candidatus Yanofskybacteria bacterium]